MNRSLKIVCLALLMAPTSRDALAQTDRVRRIDGSTPGRVTRVTRDSITVESSGREQSIPIDQLRGVIFGGEPSALSQARVHAGSGGYATALDLLAEVSRSEIENPLVEQDLAFYDAYCRAKQAIVAERGASQAAKGLTDFLRANRDSFHYYQALETLGELFSSAEEHDRAAKAFKMLADAESPVIRLRAELLSGEAAQSRGDHRAAIQRFDRVIATAEGDAAAEARRRATLGKAASLARGDRLSEALALVKNVLDRVDPKDTASQAAAYNTAGRCYASSGKPTDALFAYLHTDLLFSAEKERHAEALAGLAPLWEELGEPEEARRALARLRKEHAGSRWARQAE